MTAEVFAWTVFIAGFFLVCCALAWALERMGIR